MNHIRKETIGSYGSGWHQFQEFCQGYGVNPQLASLPLIVKFICYLYNSGVSCSVMGTAISKYCNTDLNTCKKVGKHTLVATAQKAFWQLKPPLPKYHCTCDVKLILRFIENLGENKTLTLKQMSEKTAFLVAFSTLSRYSFRPSRANSASLTQIT